MFCLKEYLQIIPSLGAGQYLGAAPCRNWLIFLYCASDIFAEIRLYQCVTKHHHYLLTHSEEVTTPGGASHLSNGAVGQVIHIVVDQSISLPRKRTAL